MITTEQTKKYAAIVFELNDSDIGKGITESLIDKLQSRGDPVFIYAGLAESPIPALNKLRKVEQEYKTYRYPPISEDAIEIINCTVQEE